MTACCQDWNNTAETPPKHYQNTETNEKKRIKKRENLGRDGGKKGWKNSLNGKNGRPTGKRRRRERMKTHLMRFQKKEKKKQPWNLHLSALHSLLSRFFFLFEKKSAWTPSRMAVLRYTDFFCLLHKWFFLLLLLFFMREKRTADGRLCEEYFHCDKKTFLDTVTPQAKLLALDSLKCSLACARWRTNR